MLGGGSGFGISIHALREEGDAACSTFAACQRDFYPRPPRGGRLAGADADTVGGVFLSTPSARRATDAQIGFGIHQKISIHALREEGDCRPISCRLAPKISIHALREEGDFSSTAEIIAYNKFLSTPSARRATL